MNTLFDVTQATQPTELLTIEIFISQDEEQDYLSRLINWTLRACIFTSMKQKERVLSFRRGWSFTNQCLKKEAIPEKSNFLVESIANHLYIPKGSIAQFLIT